jgi:sugar phosphate permease
MGPARTLVVGEGIPSVTPAGPEARPTLPPSRLSWSVWGLGALLYLVAFYQRVAPAVFSDRLMAEFALDGAALGNLSAFYFYAYVVMQIPTGLLADRWGPRRLLIAGATAAALGTMLFALAPSYTWAGIGRLTVGASVAVGFVSMLKLAGHWFPARQYSLVSGMALLTGITGGVIAGVPLRMLIEAFGWRPVMLVSAAITALLAVVIWRRVRDDPSDLGYASHFQHHADGNHAPILRSLAEVLSFRNSWLLTLAPIGFSGAVLTFAGLWGVPWLEQVRGQSPRAAAAITSTLLVAWALGGPLLGTWSERMGRRKPLYLASGLVALAGWLALVFTTPSTPLLIALLFVIGIASGNIIIGFAWAKESVPLRLMGTASGVCNMGPLLGGVLLQPGIGWMLDRHWTGAAAGGVRLYDAAAWQSSFALLVTAVAICLALVMLARESHCRQTGEAARGDPTITN